MKLALKIYLISSVLRILLIFISSQLTLIGLDSDAVGFFERVQLFSWSNFNLLSTDSNIFVVWNYCVMSITGDSMFYGQIFCFLAWSISFLFFLKAIFLFNISRNVFISVLFIYSFLPSTVLYSIGFLRESYELMFCNMGLYFFLRFEKHSSFIYWVISFVCFVFAGLLHVNFVVYIVFVFLWPFLRYVLINGSNLRRVLIIFIIVCFASLLLSSEFVFNSLNYHALGAESTSDARANYFDFAESRSILLGFIKFLYEPFLRSGLKLQDWVVILENIIRLSMLCICIFNLRSSIVLNSSFLFFLIGTFSWSLFTYNWGTGIRHHMPQLGMLLILFISASQRDSFVGQK